jgi:cytochrome c peroxidase
VLVPVGVLALPRPSARPDAMKKLLGLMSLLAALAVAYLLWPRPEPMSPAPRRGAAAGRAGRPGEPISPLAAASGLDPRKVELGRRLFNDPRLSVDGSISCATCHDLAAGGADHRVVPVGVGGAPDRINAPTVFNAALNFRWFWDGRAGSLAEQIDDARQTELQATWVEIIGHLGADPDYRRRFRQLYGEGIEPATITDALVTFLESLATPGSRFDRYLLGDDEALTADEREGYRLFKSYGCVSCHQGAGVGGNMFQKLGALGDYFGDRGGITAADYGRFNVTGDEDDRFVFKVPMLRNVALTAPYFHDGQAPTLEMAVQTMARYQLGRRLSAEETRSIVAFLGTLTGDYQGRPLDGAGGGG